MARIFIIVLLAAMATSGSSLSQEPDKQQIADIIEKVELLNRSFSERVEKINRKEEILEILSRDEDISIYFDNMIFNLEQIRSELEPKSAFITALDAQEEKLRSLMKSVRSDKDVLGDERFEYIAIRIEEDLRRHLELKQEIGDGISEIDRGIVEIKSLKLFMTYQVQLSQYSDAMDTVDSAIAILERSSQSLSRISNIVEPVSSVSN